MIINLIMVQLTDIPDIVLQPFEGTDSIRLKDVVDDGTEIIVWQLSCPFCKTLLSLENQDQTTRKITINIDERIGKKAKRHAEEWDTMDHYHVEDDERDTLMEFFEITTVPKSIMVEDDVFDALSQYS